MDEKLSRIMPRNKTGIYASEIRNMLVPNSGETQQKTSTSVPRSDIGFRKHSAFKVNLKPRQPLANVNIKLMEQKRPNTKESHPHEFVIDDESDKNSHTFNEAENYIESLVANKHRFRPSTVLRKNKLTDDKTGLPSSRSSSSKSISLYNRNKNTILNPEIAKSLSPIIINRKEIKSSRTDHFASHRQKTQIAKENFDNEVKFKETSESELLSPKTRTDTTSISNGMNNNLYHGKTKLDLFKEIYQNLNNKGKNNLRSGIGSKRYSFEDIRFGDENVELLVKNLNEEEFVNLLKEYRKTHELNLNTAMHKNKNTNAKSTANSRSQAKIINLKGEFERCSTFANIYTHSNTRFPFVRKKNQFNSNQNDFLINSNRLPDYFVNYLNNKILIRTSTKNYFGILANKNVDFPTAHYFKELAKTETKVDNDLNQTLNEPSPSLEQDDNAENQKFQQQLKILNIPTTAN